jgi:hypothetical protein
MNIFSVKKSERAVTLATHYISTQIGVIICKWFERIISFELRLFHSKCDTLFMYVYSLAIALCHALRMRERDCVSRCRPFYGPHRQSRRREDKKEGGGGGGFIMDFPSRTVYLSFN